MNNICIFSNVTFMDGGGSKRPANLARAFLKRGCKVLFVNIYPSYESIQFEVKNEKNIANLKLVDIKDFDIKKYLEFNCDLIINELPHYSVYPILKAIKSKQPEVKILSEIIDHWNTSLGNNWYNEEIEKKIFDLSNKITVTAKALEEIVKGNKDVIREVAYIPNAVDLDIFNKTKRYKRPVDLPKGKPIVFYMGALWGEWIDFNIIEIASKKYPEYNFVLVGDRNKYIDFRFKDYDNVFLLGLKAVRELPAYVKAVDLCILPFKFDDTKIIPYVSPLKIFEYMAMEKIVLATRYKEIEEMPAIFLANNREEFIELIPELIDKKIKAGLQVLNNEFIKKNNYNYRAEQILNLFSPLVSIVLPTYNHSSYLEEAIKGVLSQTYKNIELIIVNDGSTDGTANILNKYKKNKNIKIITHSVNRGLPAALNTGFKEATGEYYTWTSADNIQLPEQIETLVNILEGNPQKALVYSNYQIIDGEGKPLINGNNRIHNRTAEDKSLVILPFLIDRKNFLESKDNFLGASFLYRRTAALEIGEYDINLFGAEDYDFWLRLLDKFEAVHCDEILYKYRFHKDTLNARAKELKIFDKLKKVYEKNRNFRLNKQYKTKVVFHVDRMTPGGLEKVVYSLIKSIDRNKFKPYLVICDREAGYFGEKLKKENYKVFCINHSVEKLREIVNSISPDVVNIHYTTFGIDEYRNKKIPMVYTCHNNYIWHGEKEKNYRKVVYRQYFNSFIAVSGTVKTYFSNRYCVTREKIRVIPNGLLPEYIQNTITREQLGFIDEDFIFITPASFSTVKLQNLIIETLEKVRDKNIKCLFIGGASNVNYYDYCQLKIKELGLQDRVKIIENASPESVFEYYRISDCLLMPSLTEGWSISAMEAINEELPLLLSDVGSARDVIKSNGIVIQNLEKIERVTGENLYSVLNSYKNNIPYLKDAMEKMVNNYEHYKTNAVKQRDVILNTFSIENMIRAYEEEFTKCLSK